MSLKGSEVKEQSQKLFSMDVRASALHSHFEYFLSAWLRARLVYYTGCRQLSLFCARTVTAARDGASASTKKGLMKSANAKKRCEHWHELLEGCFGSITLLETGHGWCRTVNVLSYKVHWCITRKSMIYCRLVLECSSHNLVIINTILY